FGKNIHFVAIYSRPSITLGFGSQPKARSLMASKAKVMVGRLDSSLRNEDFMEIKSLAHLPPSPPSLPGWLVHCLRLDVPPRAFRNQDGPSLDELRQLPGGETQDKTRRSVG
ncbi:PDZ domain-containing protein 4, partial [Frankliniella fusca]